MTVPWHIWVIKQNKFSHIEHFLETSVPQVEEVFFPTVPKEHKVGNRVYKKRVPLYSGYLFLKYSDVNEKIFYLLRAQPFFTTYVGKCDERSVNRMRLKEEWNVLNKTVDIGDSVEVTSGPFNKCKGVVNAINGNRITIKTTLFGRDIDHVLSSEDLEIINRD